MAKSTWSLVTIKSGKKKLKLAAKKIFPRLLIPACCVFYRKKENARKFLVFLGAFGGGRLARISRDVTGQSRPRASVCRISWLNLSRSSQEKKLKTRNKETFLHGSLFLHAVISVEKKYAKKILVFLRLHLMQLFIPS